MSLVISGRDLVKEFMTEGEAVKLYEKVSGKKKKLIRQSLQQKNDRQYRFGSRREF